MTDLVSKVIQLQAMSLQLPDVAGHPNRLPFSGILTRVGKPSDSAPSGSGGKRVMITAEAAERALPSLMGMGINLTEKMDGHIPTAKIGIITDAHVEADAIQISGFIYSADHPAQAKKILAEQAQLGFSFEARNLTVEASDADPLVITDLYFTGASVLLKSAAAYKTTRLAAMAAMAAIEKEDNMSPEEFKVGLDQALAGALAPVSAQITALTAAQKDLEVRVAKVSDVFTEQAERAAKIEPAAASLEKTAAAMEAAGMSDQAEIMRRQAAAMRTDAAAGRSPQPLQVVPHVFQPPAQQQPAAPRLEDSEAYKSLQASVEKMAKDLAAANDQIAAAATKMADMKAAADTARPAPDRKTLAPHLSSLMAKAGMEMPGDESGQIPLAKLDKVLGESSLNRDQKITLKTGLARAGILNPTAQ